MTDYRADYYAAKKHAHDHGDHVHDDHAPVNEHDNGPPSDFEITTSALRTLMIEKGYMTEQELAAKMEEVRARFNVPDEMESPLKKKGQAK